MPHDPHALFYMIDCVPINCQMYAEAALSASIGSASRNEKAPASSRLDGGSSEIFFFFLNRKHSREFHPVVNLHTLCAVVQVSGKCIGLI